MIQLPMDGEVIMGKMLNLLLSKQDIIAISYPILVES